MTIKQSSEMPGSDPRRRAEVFDAVFVEESSMQ
jgi:hypothetical protein